MLKEIEVFTARTRYAHALEVLLYQPVRPAHDGFGFGFLHSGCPAEMEDLATAAVNRHQDVVGLVYATQSSRRPFGLVIMLRTLVGVHVIEDVVPVYRGEGSPLLLYSNRARTWFGVTTRGLLDEIDGPSSGPDQHAVQEG